MQTLEEILFKRSEFPQLKNKCSFSIIMLRGYLPEDQEKVVYSVAWA
jgi:hypothetical protein